MVLEGMLNDAWSVLHANLWRAQANAHDSDTWITQVQVVQSGRYVGGWPLTR